MSTTLKSWFMHWQRALSIGMVCTASAALLAACGGGGGGGGSSPPPPAPAPDYVVSCSAATNTCASSGPVTEDHAGAWVLTNPTGSDALVGITVTGLTTPQTILLSLTNQATSTTASVPANFYALKTSGPEESGASVQKSKLDEAAFKHHVGMRHFRQPLIRDMRAKSNMLMPVSVSAVITTSFAVGNTKTWVHAISETEFADMPATLRASQQLPDGKWAHFWVHDSEWGAGKVTASIIDDYTSTFSAAGTGIYARSTTNTQGNIWGPHPYSNLIPATTTDMHVVIGNFDNNSTPYGVVGYFFALNNFLKSSGGCSQCAHSNEALVFFIDSETIYLGGEAGKKSSKSVLIHELVHMINYYQRDVTLGVSFDSWLEEMSALMMQDLLDTTYSIPSTVATSYMNGWAHDHSYRCSPFVFDGTLGSDCFSYQIGSVLGAHILRKHGLGFYQDLLKTTQSDSLVALNSVLVPRADSAMRSAAQVNAVAAMLKNTTVPTAYRFPAVPGSTFSLPEILPQDYGTYQPAPYPQPATLPSGAGAISEFSSSSATWTKIITLPKNSSLTIVLRK